MVVTPPRYPQASRPLVDTSTVDKRRIAVLTAAVRGIKLALDQGDASLAQQWIKAIIKD